MCVFILLRVQGWMNVTFGFSLIIRLYYLIWFVTLKHNIFVCLLQTVDQHLYFQDNYVFYQFSSEECSYLYCEFEREEEWQNGVKLLLQLVHLLPARAGTYDLWVRAVGHQCKLFSSREHVLCPGLCSASSGLCLVCVVGILLPSSQRKVRNIVEESC